MPGLADKWAGRIYGTNTGNLFIEIAQEGVDVSGIIRLMDNAYGLAIYKLVGTFDEKLKLDCKPHQAPQGIELGEVTVEAVLTPEGNLRGTWQSTLGTAGTFDAFPHNTHAPQTSSEAEKIPEQLYNKNIPIGSIRLFSEDIRRLITFVGQDFKQATPIITYNLRGSQVTKYAHDFLNDIDISRTNKILKDNNPRTRGPRNQQGVSD